MPLLLDAQPYLWRSLAFLVVEEERKTFPQKWKFFSRFGFLLLAYVLVGVCAFIFAVFETNEPELVHLKLRSLTLVCASFQAIASHLDIVFNGSRWRALLDSSNLLYKKIKADQMYSEFLLHADTTSRKHRKIFAIGLVGVFGIPIGRSLLLSAVKGQIHYAFELSTLGSPPLVGWCWNVLITVPIALFIWDFYGLLDGIVLQLIAYTRIMAFMLQNRPITCQFEYDRQIVNFQREVLILKKTVMDLCGFVGFLEIFLTALRSSFCFYHMLMAVHSNNYEFLIIVMGFIVTTLSITYVLCTCGQTLENQCDEINSAIYSSNWYRCQPKDRKTLIILSIFNNHSRKFHYKHVVTFNYITLAAVLQSSFSLVTVLSNFM